MQLYIMGHMKNARKRNNQFVMRLNNSELGHLNKLVRNSKLSRESYLRMIINGLVPRAAPSEELIDTIILLRGISNDIHSIAVKNPDEIKYQSDFVMLQEEITKIMYLIRQPTSLEELWQSQKYGQ